VFSGQTTELGGPIEGLLLLGSMSERGATSKTHSELTIGVAG